MARIVIKDLSLGELYARDKITSSVEEAIVTKEDFSKIQPSYCEKVCRLKCKGHQQVSLMGSQDHVDVLIIQNFPEPNSKFDEKRGEGATEKVNMRILDLLIQKSGVNKLKYNVVNLVKCPMPKSNLNAAGKLTFIQMEKCAPYLLSEIQRTKPKAIISLTTEVTKCLGFPKASNTGNRGEILGGNVVVTLHPKTLLMIRQNASGKMWSSDYFEVIRRDFEKAYKIATGKLVLGSLEDGIEAIKHRVRVTQSLEEVQELADFLMDGKASNMVSSLDTETTGLNPLAEDAKLLTIQVGYRDKQDGLTKAVVVPLFHRENKAYDPKQALEILRPYLEDEKCQKVLHNGKFDVLYIYHTTGIRVQGILIDTMLALHDIDSGAQGTYSLKTGIWDFIPHLQIGGYETLLPKLTKGKAATEEQETETEEE